MERSNGRPDEQADARTGAAAGRPPTIRGVAERAGVSKSLVSLVLQGSPRVSDTKRQAVLHAIEELGYRPNAAARSLVARRTHTVGVLLNDMRNPWFVEVLDGLNSLLQAHGLRMLMADGRLDRRAGQDFARTFQELRVDGLVVVGTLRTPTASPRSPRGCPPSSRATTNPGCRTPTSSPTTTSAAPGSPPSTSSASATAGSPTSPDRAWSAS